MVDTAINPTPEDLNNILKILKEMNGSWWSSATVKGVLDAWQPLIEYEGFDALRCAYLFHKYSQQDKGEYTEDLAFCIMLFMERGSDIDKLSSAQKCKMDEEGRNKVQEIKSRYNMVKSGKKATKNQLTLPRIALAHPHIACQYAKLRRNWPFIVAEEELKPLAIQAYSSIMPDMKAPDNEVIVVKAHCWYMLKLSLVISKEFNRKSPTAQKEEVTKFVMNGKSSSLDFTADQRLNFNIELGLMEKAADGTVIFKRAVWEAIKRVAEEFTNYDR